MYISDTEYDLTPPSIDTFAVSQTAKQKFCFPSQDPQPNVIVDNRSEPKIVEDILRIWSQVLRPDALVRNRGEGPVGIIESSVRHETAQELY